MTKAGYLTSVVVSALLPSSLMAAEDPHIKQVEQGLLPIAAIHPGVSVNIEDRMRAYGVPGLSIAVIDGGRIAWAKGYGLADSVSGRPVNSKTLFQAASISKPISAMGVLLLVQQGRLQLDEGANQALVSWKIPDNRFTRGHPVSVRMLLNHTDGLDHPDSDFGPHYAGGQRLPGHIRLGPELAVGGLWTTPTDVAQYVISVQKAYAGSEGGPLEPKMAHEMLAPGLGSRGLGPAISGAGQTSRFGHDGFNEGFESSFIAYERRGQGAVVMANSGFAFMLIKEVLSSVSRVYGWPDYGATTQQPPSAMIQQQPVSPVSAEVLGAAAGHYLSGGTRITIYSDGNRLLLEWPTNGVAEVFAVPGGRFFCPPLTFSDVGSPWLKFVRDSKGIVTKILAGDDGSIEFRRLEHAPGSANSPPAPAPAV